MTLRRHAKPFRAALGLGLALALPSLASAQVTGGGESLSSGSGAGTGTGTGAGAGINSTGGGTGLITGPGSGRGGVGIGDGLRGGPDGLGGVEPLSPDELSRLPGFRPVVPSPGRGTSPSLPTDSMLVPLDEIASPLTVGGMSRGMSLEGLNALDDRLLPLTRTITDPSQRALALERVARSKIFSNELAEAHDALAEAGASALRLSPGLERDTRLMGIVTALLSLAHRQVQESLSNTSVFDLPELLGVPESDPDRTAKLDAARQAWRRAAGLSLHIASVNARSETLYTIVENQSNETQAIALAATKAASTRDDLREEGPAMLDFADATLVQGFAFASRIDLPVWRDQAMETLAIGSGRSRQFGRGLQIARSIPQPQPRSEALIEVAEAMARQAAEFRSDHDRLRDTVSRIDRLIGRGRSSPSPGDLSRSGQGLADDLLTLGDDLDSLPAIIRQRGGGLRLLLEQQARTRRDTQARQDVLAMIDRVDAATSRASQVEEALNPLREALFNLVEASASLPSGERQETIDRALSGLDEGSIDGLREQLRGLVAAVDALGFEIDRRATVAYGEAARGIASIVHTDPRDVLSGVLIDSLIAVGRFDDARRSVALLSKAAYQVYALGSIAESQGRRGLADAARKWIAREVAPEYRGQLVRRVDQGIIATVNEMRTRVQNTSSDDEGEVSPEAD